MSNNYCEADEASRCLCQKARSIWLETSVDGDLDTVEQIYRDVWASSTVTKNPTTISGDGEDAANDQAQKKPKLEISCAQRQAGEKLALILLQSGRAREADAILQTLGYTCRLAESVLNYETRALEAATDDKNDTSTATDSVPCRIYDDFLTKAELQMLQSVFLDPKASYWTEHNYTVEPPSPYFSYLIPLGDDTTSDDFGGIGTFLRKLQAFLSGNNDSLFPAVKQATFVEMWAHNRPHATGHQFHFDSDNEGCTGGIIRNPICSCVVYLSSGAAAGGPSIITNQRLASRHLASITGWSCPANVAGRLVAFDGKVLHGVVPGVKQQGTTRNTSASTTNHRRRVTVMFAFWRRIRVRQDDDGRPGAARPFPTQPEWSRQLRKPLIATTTTTKGNDDNDRRMPIQRKPLPLDHVYESVLEGGKAWTRKMGFPDYEQIFQGF